MLDCLGWIKNGDTDGIIKCKFGKNNKLPYQSVRKLQFIFHWMSDAIDALDLFYIVFIHSNEMCYHCYVCLHLLQTHAKKNTNQFTQAYKKKILKNKKAKEREK